MFVFLNVKFPISVRMAGPNKLNFFEVTPGYPWMLIAHRQVINNYKKIDKNIYFFLL